MAFVSLPRMGMRRWIFNALLWAATQAVWLHYAYRLEFEGQSCFTQLWAASMVFFISNVLLAGQFITKRLQSQQQSPLYSAPGILSNCS